MRSIVVLMREFLWIIGRMGRGTVTVVNRLGRTRKTTPITHPPCEEPVYARGRTCQRSPGGDFTFVRSVPTLSRSDIKEPVMSTRTERDSMGETHVPADAYYGASTARAVENFPISPLRFPRPFIAAMGLIKWAAAEVNKKLGVLDEPKASLLQRAAQEVIDGKLDNQFVVDIFQTG